MTNYFSKLIARRHLGATRVLGYALTLSDEVAWEGASAVWQARLEPEECAALAWAALRSLDHDGALRVAETVLGGAGTPLPPFLDPIDDALWWAAYASPNELEAYALSTFMALSQDKRREFVEYVQEAA
ncbi:hypothetical protein [Pseudooceanicola spongiae]|uniref:Uncharacterized protein n=1 Tax=Pseudooceanicola spongiae TaxID=2613965 RepID=A0A7L9WT09_9RHOB|nr:hypothetical protein [Pseudooceanicola spongiae]QOL82658.1 hypothetical protein F3W81_18635 [Pseudooceanicola spongiae]